jgi:hypothetical protein
MTYCGYCGSNLLQREENKDITCLACSRTLSVGPLGLPYVTPNKLRRVLPGPRTSKGPGKVAAA